MCVDLPGNVLMWSNYDVSDLLLEFWGGLQVGSEDLSMFSQMEVKCIAGPLPDDFHGLEGYSLKEVFECGANSDAMAL